MLYAKKESIYFVRTIGGMENLVINTVNREKIEMIISKWFKVELFIEKLWLP